MHKKPILASVLAASCALAFVASTRVPAVAASAPLLAIGPIPIDSLPFAITAPGTYCLTQNLVGPPGGLGISVSVDGVTIDLGGHELSGGGEGQDAIYCPSSTDLTVRNGRITDWVHVAILAVDRLHASDVSITGNTDTGIFAGVGSLLERVQVEGVMEVGIRAGFGATVRDARLRMGPASGTALLLGEHGCAEKLVVSGAELGIVALANSMVRDCDVRSASTWCIEAHERVVLDGVDVFSNVAGGIEIQNGCTVRNCEVFGAPLDGIHVVGRDNRIEGNSLRDNGTGLRVVGGHNLVVRNMAFENGQDFVVAPLNAVGPILRDFMTIGSTNPHANHATPFL